MNFFKLMLSTSIIHLTLFSGIAVAQSTMTEVHPNFENSWTGIYGGFNIGSIFNNAGLRSNHLGLTDPTGTCNANLTFTSFFPGLQLGYLSQFESNIVLGVEGDFTYNANQTGRVACTCPLTPNVSDSYAIKDRLQGFCSRSTRLFSQASNTSFYISWRKFC